MRYELYSDDDFSFKMAHACMKQCFFYYSKKKINPTDQELKKTLFYLMGNMFNNGEIVDNAVEEFRNEMEIKRLNAEES